MCPAARITTQCTVVFAWLWLTACPGLAGGSFVNWENAQVHPLDRTPDGALLLVVNTADARLEVLDITAELPVPLYSIPVGLDPVSVRARTDTEAWVVNHVSDSISIVDLSTQNVVATLRTADEPADVVFAGKPQRALVSCSQVNTIQVFDLDNLEAAPQQLILDAEEPRALAVSPDGGTVYVAIFESGNGTTILGGGREFPEAFGMAFPPNVVSDPIGPYGGQNPPPNDAITFNPPMNPENPVPPEVGLIIRKDEQGLWRDDNTGDWTALVSGDQAAASGRPVGWDLTDHDVAVIDVDTLQVSYAGGLMNIVMAVAVNPVSGEVTVVGTDATNEVRFEPNLNGRFLRVRMATVDPRTGVSELTDLNPHLTYTTPTIPQEQRDLSIGDPRAIAWNAEGTRAYVAGLGSNNVVAVDQFGSRAGQAPILEVGEGPTGLVLDDTAQRLYVLNRFDATVSTFDTRSGKLLAEVSLFDPTPPAITNGRRHLYDTHGTSGLGHVACASCHVDARMDRLAWDLGNPAGVVKPFNQNCDFGSEFLPGDCQDWHPMKGPMVTMTLQDIIGKEPHHWRGDRDGIEEFNGAFVSLLGDDELLSPEEMQEFEDFLATITFPPNPFRNFDNTLPDDLPLPGHYSSGRFGPAGVPLPNGNAQLGQQLVRFGKLGGGIILGHTQCVTCHTLPTGTGSNLHRVDGQFVPFPTGPNGELHHAVLSVDDATQISLDVPQLRNLHERVGFDTTQMSNRAGFGFTHNGAVDSLARFISEPIFFGLFSDQQVADVVAFMLAFSGSDLAQGSDVDIFFPGLLGPLSQDTHAAVGFQVTVDGTNNDDPSVVDLVAEMIAAADAPEDDNPGPRVGVVAKGRQGAQHRGYAYVGGNLFQSDRAAETVSSEALRGAAAVGAEITFTAVPQISALRLGIDRDEDGFFDGDELDACSNPADAQSIPADCDADGIADGCEILADPRLDGNGDGVLDRCGCATDLTADGMINASDLAVLLGAWGPSPGHAADFNNSGAVDAADLAALLGTWGSCG